MDPEKATLGGEAVPPLVERWLPVAGYGGRYEVSDQGRVRSFHRHPSRLMRPRRSDKGYLKVQLTVQNKTVTRSVHRMVLEAFVGPQPTGHEGAHRDGNPGNNWLSNLGWLTRQQNAQEREDQRRARGIPHHSRKLTPELIVAVEVALVRNTIRPVARQFGISVRSVWKVKHGIAA